jgi:hypothetical protein
MAEEERADRFITPPVVEQNVTDELGEILVAMGVYNKKIEENIDFGEYSNLDYNSFTTEKRKNGKGKPAPKAASVTVLNKNENV